jgi:chorismate mutase/prephenate dehydrogenase
MPRTTRAEPPEPAPEPESLTALRARVDALDHEMLSVLERRMRLVTEIAAWKRTHGLRIRDAVREQQVLDDRAAVAEELSLPRDAVESLFRVLMRASRDRQAALGAELPPDMPVHRVAVIGAAGGMGRLLVRLFAEWGQTVLEVDRDTRLRAEEAAASADVTVVSVPIGDTEAVIRAVGAHVPERGLLMDVTSLKEAPVAAMLASTRASVVGTHPMFGPDVHSLQGQRVVLCRARGETWAEWVARLFAARGMTVIESTPDDHDRAMAVVQVLTHYQTQVLGLTLARAGTPVEETRRFSSPAYLLELVVTARHFAQSAELYGPIEMRNRRTAEITSAFREAAGEVAGILERGDQEAFDTLFAEVRRYFHGFTEEALEQSTHLIDRLVERA